MQRGGGADAAKLVGAGRGDAPDGHLTGRGVRPQRLEQGLGHRVRRATQADGVLAPRSRRTHVRTARQDQGQRAGPEGRHQRCCKVWHIARKMRHRTRVGYVDYQRVVAGPAFSGKNFGDGGRAGRICAKPVHRFGWQANQVAGPYQASADRY